MSRTASGAGRRSFGRVVLLGLAAAGLASVAGHRPWVGVTSGDAQSRSLAEATITSGAALAESPLAGALGLVTLAAWGVLLVTRGVVRRVVAVLGLGAAVGLVVATVIGYNEVPDALRDALGETTVGVGRTAWFWLTLLGALLSVAATALAVRLVPSWPEMGTRYDAPTTATTSTTSTTSTTEAVGEPAEQTNLDLWKSIDQGHDPTT